MEFRFSDEEERFRQELLAFLEQELPPDWLPWDQGEIYSKEGFPFTRQMAKKLAAKGWLTLAWPKEYGGQGRSPMEQLIYVEEMAYRGVPGTDLGVGATRWIGPAIMMYGTEEQKREHLPPITRGERFWCTLYSEPGTGSDLASLQTRAVRDGDDYVITGEKVWTTAGHVADWGWIAVRTDPTAPKHKGISLFVVDMKSPGIRVEPIYSMTGIPEFNSVHFDGVRVPKTNLVGEENKGWYLLAVALDFERSGVQYPAISRWTLEALARYARETHRDGRPLAQDPVVRHKISDRYVEVEAARLLAYNVAWLQSRNELPNVEASYSKLLGTESYQRTCRTAMEVIGLYGMLDGPHPRAVLKGYFKRGYLFTVSRTIAAGTSEIQRNIIATRGLGLPRG